MPMNQLKAIEKTTTDLVIGCKGDPHISVETECRGARSRVRPAGHQLSLQHSAFIMHRHVSKGS
jgi:hypothetical protein